MIAQLDMAHIAMRPDRIVTIVSGVGCTIWLIFVVTGHLNAIMAIVALPIILGGIAWLVRFFVNKRVLKRRDAFMDQLEMALRLMSGGVRIGLSLQRAMSHIITEMTDPARSEFERVIMQTRLGVELPDALDSLAERMTGNETIMLARVIRVQRQTGGNLSTILEHLASTIKERRHIQRKISTLTAEGRMGALVLESLPVGVALVLILVEHNLGSALLGTWIGHAALGLAGSLEFMAIFVLNKMLQVDV